VSEILTCEEAIAKYVRGGDTIAVGGFTVTRKPSDPGVMRFDKAAKRMYLAEYYPGVSAPTANCRRARLPALLLLLALCLAVLSACGGSAGTGEGQAPAASGGSAALQAGPIKAVVGEVTDGDTFRAVLTDGREEKVRLIGVDTPESTNEVEPYGREAAAYTKERLSGRTVYLEPDVGERDKYGRFLAYVWLEPPRSGAEAEVRTKMYNAELLLAGMAQVMTVPPNVRYANLFVKLEAEAREGKKGLWAAAPAKYVGNANSKKFHRPECEWGAKIAPQNRVEFATREAAVQAGYEPCGSCKP
jgi:micrococcal nuclease